MDMHWGEARRSHLSWKHWSSLDWSYLWRALNNWCWCLLSINRKLFVLFLFNHRSIVERSLYLHLLLRNFKSTLETFILVRNNPLYLIDLLSNVSSLIDDLFEQSLKPLSDSSLRICQRRLLLHQLPDQR